MLFLGITTARLILTGSFGWFVQQRMRIPLAVAALLLLAFGLYDLFRPVDETVGDGTGDHDHDHDHDHRHDQETHANDHRAGPRVGWLLLLPLLVLISVAPTALGAAAAQRVEAYVPAEASDDYAPIAGAADDDPTDRSEGEASDPADGGDPSSDGAGTEAGPPPESWRSPGRSRPRPSP